MSVPQPDWMPLRLLERRFAANVGAIAGRDPELGKKLNALIPSTPYFIRTENDRLLLGRGAPGDITVLPSIMSPASARATQNKLYPAGTYHEPALIAGEDVGWLWNCLYEMKCQTPRSPGHRAPLYFLIKDLERFRVILHIQDWAKLLADNRVRLFAGEDCVDQFRTSLTEQVMCQWPTASVTVDPLVWPAGVTLESCYIEGRQKQNAELARLSSQFEFIYRQRTPAKLAELFQSGRPLRVLGITSRYTSFLQYSMRDWLEAFRRLGHQTRLLMETADHEQPNNLAVARECEDFKPDLCVVIDHFRGEVSGIPAEVPVVMWVQDRLPTIYCPQAGQQQGRLDYTIGYGFLELTQTHGYPASRFMPTMMAVNESRFSPRKRTAGETEKYRCDVSFVTNCTMPAEQIIRDAAKAVGSPRAVRLFDQVYQRLRAIYDAGGSVTSGYKLRAIIVQATIDQAVNTDIDQVLDLFLQRVNNALFRHQAIRWVAEMGVDLHLYGEGWENHPEFARFARGVADNDSQLPLIYQASAINLQVTPFGAVHQRLLEGLACGGFFLLRSTVADELELLLREMHKWCVTRNIRDAAGMVKHQDPALLRLTRKYADLSGSDPLDRPEYYFGSLGECSLSGWTRTANTLWNDSDRVTFNTREQVQSLVRHFLNAPQERRRLTESMRSRVLETHTYESITRRMLNMIGSDLKSVEQKARPSLAA